MVKARKGRIRIPEMTADSPKAIRNSNRATDNLRKEGYIPSGNRRAEEMVRKGDRKVGTPSKSSAAKSAAVKPKISTAKKKPTIKSTSRKSPMNSKNAKTRERALQYKKRAAS